MTVAHVNAIGAAVPPHQVHDAFVAFVRESLPPKAQRLFDRMVVRAGIEQRYSFIEPERLPDGRLTDTERFYGLDEWPSTGARMARYERHACDLAVAAIEALGDAFVPETITHVVVASCTGFTAPGLDQQIIAATGIPASAERTVVGFMGCYAAVNALRLAHHTVRSEPGARVLVVNLELCTLHFQRSDDMEKLLSMLLFGDGAAAAIVSADETGVALIDFRSAAIPGSADAITWNIRDQGFDMHLDGQVPALIAAALAAERARNDCEGLMRGTQPSDYDRWAVHAGGRTILDAVERALDLPGDALEPSRRVLRDHGNMSSATLMFVLRDMLAARTKGAPAERGMALAFGPGLAAESFRFELV
jgi:predicted naringenin-chalcone synthase